MAVNTQLQQSPKSIDLRVIPTYPPVSPVSKKSNQNDDYEAPMQSKSLADDENISQDHKKNTAQSPGQKKKVTSKRSPYSNKRNTVQDSTKNKVNSVLTQMKEAGTAMSGGQPEESSRHESPLERRGNSVSRIHGGNFDMDIDIKDQKDGPRETTTGQGHISVTTDMRNSSHRRNQEPGNHTGTSGAVTTTLNVQGVKLQKENSQPEVTQKSPTLLLENQNTNTARLLVNTDSLMEVELASGGLDTKRPSLLEVTEAANSSEVAIGAFKAAAAQAETSIVKKISLMQAAEADSSTHYADSQAHLGQLDAGSFKGQMLSFLQNEAIKSNVSDVRRTDFVKKSSEVVQEAICLCEHNHDEIYTLRKNEVTDSKQNESQEMGQSKDLIEVNEALVTESTGRAVEKIKSAQWGITHGDAEIAQSGLLKRDVSPFKRLIVPSPHTVTVKTFTNTEKEKIKMIVKEMQIAQKEQLQNYDQDQALYKGSLARTKTNSVGLSNKHKTKLTNLVAQKERANAVHTHLGSMQITPIHRNVIQSSKGGFTDPLLNMITSLHTISNGDDSNRQTMYGFQKRKSSCLPAHYNKVQDSIKEQPSETILATEDGGDYMSKSALGGELSTTKSMIGQSQYQTLQSFKTSKAPLALNQQIQERKVQEQKRKQEQDRLHRKESTKRLRERQLRARRLTQDVEMKTNISKSKSPMKRDSLAAFNSASSQAMFKESDFRTNSGILGDRVKEQINKDFHSISSENYMPSNFNAKSSIIESQDQESTKKVIKIHDNENQKSSRKEQQVGQILDYSNLKNWIDEDITVIQSRLLDSEVGQRPDKNRINNVQKVRNVQTRMEQKAGVKQAAAGKTASEFINSAGTSVVISKVKNEEKTNNILEERKSSIGLQSSTKPVKADESHPDDEDHQNEYQDAVIEETKSGVMQTGVSRKKSKSKGISSVASRKNKSQYAQRSLKSSKNTTSQNEDKRSLVQMIELELPNVHTDETKVSPQRVKVLSREFTPGEQSPSNAITSKKATESQVTPVALKSFAEANNQIDEAHKNEQSFDNMINEAQILQEMEATIDSNLSSRGKKTGSSPTWDQSSQPHHNVDGSMISIEDQKLPDDVRHRTQSLPPINGTIAQPSNGHPSEHQSLIHNLRGGMHSNLSVLEASMPVKIERKGKTPIQYIQEVRALAEQYQGRRAEALEESFALVSGQASILPEDPLKSKKTYFNNLKRRDMRLKQLHNEEREIKHKEIKDQIMQARQMRNNRQKAKTQLATYKDVSLQPLGKPPALKIDLQTQEENNTEDDYIQTKNGRRKKIQKSPQTPLLENFEASKQLISPDSPTQGSHKFGVLQEAANQTSYMVGAAPVGQLLMAQTASQMTAESGKEEDREHIAAKEDTIESEAKIASDDKKTELSRVEKLKANHKGSNMTITTMDLPEKQLAEMEQYLYESQKKASHLPSPRIGEALEQIDALRVKRANQSHVQTQSNLFANTNINAAANISQKQSELSFVQIRQQQLENPDLGGVSGQKAGASRTQNQYRDSFNESRATGFKNQSAVNKKLLMHKKQNMQDRIVLNQTAKPLNIPIGGNRRRNYHQTVSNGRMHNHLQNNSLHTKVDLKQGSQYDLDLRGTQLNIDNKLSPSKEGGSASQKHFMVITQDKLPLQTDVNFGSKISNVSKGKRNRKVQLNQTQNNITMNVASKGDESLNASKVGWNEKVKYPEVREALNLKPWSKDGPPSRAAQPVVDIAKHLNSTDDEDYDEVYNSGISNQKAKRIVLAAKNKKKKQQKMLVGLVGDNGNSNYQKDVAMGTDEIMSLKSLKLGVQGSDEHLSTSKSIKEAQEGLIRVETQKSPKKSTDKKGDEGHGAGHQNKKVLSTVVVNLFEQMN